VFTDPDNAKITAIISHEIKNSLNPIIALSGILGRDKDNRFSSKEKEYFEIINRNSKKILKIIEQISLISKLKHNVIKPYFSSLNLNDFFLHLVDDNPFDLTFEFLSQSPGVFNFDATILKTIFDDLIDLYKIFGYNKINIKIKLNAQGAVFYAANSYEFDDDCLDGFSAFNLKSHNFSENAALGLYLLDQMVKVSGGSFFIKSSSGFFCCCLEFPSLDKEVNSLPLSKGDSQEIELRDFLVVVIDDDLDNHIPIKAIIDHEFNGRGKVFFASTGHDGIDLINQIKPDIVLLDISLPDISGLSLVRSIRNFFGGEKVAVIAFTAHIAEQEDIAKAGFNDIIHKPFNIDDFVARLKYWVTKNA